MILASALFAMFATAVVTAITEHSAHNRSFQTMGQKEHLLWVRILTALAAAAALLFSTGLGLAGPGEAGQRGSLARSPRLPWSIGGGIWMAPGRIDLRPARGQSSIDMKRSTHHVDAP